MYLHIGNNIVINEKEIIGIFDIESLNKKNYFLNKLKDLKNSKQIIDISDGKEKSFILLKREEDIVIYISNISSLTLARRINEH